MNFTSPFSDLPDQAAAEEFVQLLTKEQNKLLHFITMLLAGDVQAAENVLQETNLVLWRKAREFEVGTSFQAWSRSVARWQVQAHLRDRSRDRLIFNDELVDQLSSRDISKITQPETRGALKNCVEGLRKNQSNLLSLRYTDELPIRTISVREGRSEAAIRSALKRIRRALLACIQSKLATSE
ncbi:sigma-70 family RNA polymerase sigma factor [Aeoliella sp. ICT_H6.2]|uniref:Sigma-70 family RNA polymerase sigma factor n=1 Tax=Aeoliella straminimaris TaxID=2954799 RepID=A0A9X2FBF9_9BACT|nr:sigma-70 family RNA polymerase sigma factor [Aeoliella straminimaris]MCO6043264.1 sigma-70 family RNA polymerase sigma factor [Aeoliella straminimaris]